METLAIIGLALVAAIVWVVEKIAFAVLLWMAFSWGWSATAGARRVMAGHWRTYVGPLQWRVRRWLLARQYAAGATP